MPHDRTAKEAATLTKPGTYRISRCLYLRIRPGSRAWFYRYWRAGRNVWVGLGRANVVTLEDARNKVLAFEKMRHVDELDPQAEHRRGKRNKAFQAVAEEYLAEHLPHFRNEKHKWQWKQTLEKYAFPKLGRMNCKHIRPDDVAAVLRPIWTTKHETAARLRGRIEKILDAAQAYGLREGENPATLAIVGKLLPKVSQGEPEHFAAVPWRELPDLVAAIRAKDTMSCKALLFTILTACRTNETIGAMWKEIEGDTWAIPAERGKTRKAHEVPLPKQAVELLASIPRREPYLFYGKGKTPTPLTNMAMLMALRKMKSDATTHGMRSAFRDWCAENGVERNIADPR